MSTSPCLNRARNLEEINPPIAWDNLFGTNSYRYADWSIFIRGVGGLRNLDLVHARQSRGNLQKQIQGLATRGTFTINNPPSNVDVAVPAGLTATSFRINGFELGSLSGNPWEESGGNLTYSGHISTRSLLTNQLFLDDKVSPVSADPINRGLRVRVNVNGTVHHLIIQMRGF